MFGLTTKFNKMQEATIKHENPAIGNVLLAAGKMKFCDFQVSCKKCHEIIYQDKYFVSILRNGAPEESELKRVFSYPEFDVVKTCPCCGKSNFARGYKYEPLPVSSEDYIDEDDLPF